MTFYHYCAIRILIQKSGEFAKMTGCAALECRFAGIKQQITERYDQTAVCGFGIQLCNLSLQIRGLLLCYLSIHVRSVGFACARIKTRVIALFTEHFALIF